MAKTQSSTPPFFNFLKEGLLLPARNRSLFLAVFALVVASNTSLHFVEKILNVQPISSLLNLDTKLPPFSGTDDPSRSHDFRGVGLQDDASRNIFHWLVSAGYYLASIIAGWVVRIIVLFAAVSTYSSDLRTFAVLLSKAKTQLKGPLLTRALVYALEIVGNIGLLAAMAALLVAPSVAVLQLLPFQQHKTVIYVQFLILFSAPIFLMNYFSFLCSLSVVVAVAEPRCHGAAAVALAWRLMKHRKRHVVLFAAVTAALSMAVSPLHKLAMKTSNATLVVFQEFLYRGLQDAMEVFSVCAMTAFYYECRGSTETSVSTHEC